MKAPLYSVKQKLLLNVSDNLHEVRMEGRFSADQCNALQLPFPNACINFLTDQAEILHEAVVDIVAAAAFDIATQVGLNGQMWTIFIGVFQQKRTVFPMDLSDIHPVAIRAWLRKDYNKSNCIQTTMSTRQTGRSRNPSAIKPLPQNVPQTSNRGSFCYSIHLSIFLLTILQTKH